MDSRKKFTVDEKASGQVDAPDPLLPARRTHTNPVVSSGPAPEVDAVTGSLSLSVPIYTSPGRSGFGPSLSLTYDSSQGNGVFGLGWRLSIASVTRKTTRQLPQYGPGDTDVFALSDLDDLVPIPVEQEVLRNGWRIRRYNPRTSYEASRVEQWTNTSSEDDVHWRVFSADNVTTIFGQTDQSRIFEPATEFNGGKKRIFSWLISERFDANGNNMRFRYKTEDLAGVGPSDAVYEDGTSESPQRYLKSVVYGNRVPNRQLDTWAVDPTLVPDNGWLFETVFDYGEHDLAAPTTAEIKPWALRRDPFSTHKSGFEIRTYRLCQRILMFHHIPEELSGSQDTLVSSTVFKYDEEAFPSGIPLLLSVTNHGHAPNLKTESFPPLTFEYTQAKDLSQCVLVDADCENLQFSAAGISTGVTEYLDFNGEGSPGFLTRRDGAWWYQRNESAASDPTKCEFGVPKLVQEMPNASSHAQFTDLTHNGKPGLVCGLGNDTGGLKGYYERTEDDGWVNFVPFSSSANIDLLDPRVRMVDLTGDGTADILQFTNDGGLLEWYPSLGAKGFGEQVGMQSASHPVLRVNDLDNYVYMADMTGDGLADIVQIENANIVYWPNQGYGRFGRKVTMQNAPQINEFTHERLRLSDVTGSGTTDLIYLPPGGGVHVYYNRVGNKWSDTQKISGFPQLDSVASVMVLDLLGQGTPCLCWSSPACDSLFAGTKGAFRYIDLMGGQKPGLLNTHHNGFGLESLISYAPSTKFYLQDERSSHAWETRLPFPVQCVERLVRVDRITPATATTRYTYHDGYYDPSEREFRGFGMVEQWDAQEFSGTQPDNKGKFRTPTTWLKSWFHLGKLPSAESAPGTQILKAPEEDQATTDAYRALKGHLLRTEIYNQDISQSSPRSYMSEEHTYNVATVQQRNSHGHGVYRVVQREKLTSQTERSSDLRLSHEIVLQTDDYGRVTKSASIAYGKKASDLERVGDRAKQEATVISYSETDYTNVINGNEDFRLPLPCETRQYRLSAAPEKEIFDFSTLVADDFAFFKNATETSFDDKDLKGKKVLIARNRSFYRSSDLSTCLPLGKLEEYSTIDRTYDLAMTPDILSKLSRVLNDFGTTDVKKTLQSEGGYRDLDEDNHWWVPSGQSRYSTSKDATVELKDARRGFYIARVNVDPFGVRTSMDLDSYSLFHVKQVDGVQNTTTWVCNYVAMQAKQTTDPNGNRKQTVFDALRRVVGEAVSGKLGEHIGDSLDSFKPQLTEEQIESFVKNPEGPVTRSVLGNAGRRTIYVGPKLLNGGWNPAFQAVITRDEHYKDTAQLNIHFEYLNGSGDPLQTSSLQCSGKWQCSGRIVYDLNSLPVRTFRPFFSNSHIFQSQPPSEVYPTITTLRDPMGREIGVLNADRTWTKVRHLPWAVETFDAGDTVLIEDPKEDMDVGYLFNTLDEASYTPSWYATMSSSTDADKRAAALKSKVYGGTPKVTHRDSLGRDIVMVVDNGSWGKNTTRSSFDWLGNIAQVENARGAVIKIASFDLRSRELYRIDAESGERWALYDCLDRAILSGDSRNMRRRFIYDAAGRLQEEWLMEAPRQREVLVLKSVYGESVTNATKHNLREKLYQQYDQSGSTQNSEFDFKGNCVESQIQLAEDYKNVLDWSQTGENKPGLESKIFKNITEFNARNQASKTTTPDDSFTTRTYNIGGALQVLNFEHADTNTASEFISNIIFTPDGKREQISYGNNVQISNKFNDATRELDQSQAKCISQRGKILRDVAFTYDSCGRVTHTYDSAAQDIYISGNVVKPIQDFKYDALGQIIEARGRELMDASDGKKTLKPSSPSDSLSSLPLNGAQICEYLEKYQYDSVGNITAVRHTAASDTTISGWTRNYYYEEPSCISGKSDRLSRTTVGRTSDSYGYDKNGCMTSGSTYYSSLAWDFNNRLRSSSSQIVKDGIPETTWYVYNALGHRVRKVVERSVSAGGSETPTKSKETIYLPGYQLYRTFRGDGITVAREKATFAVLEDSSDGVGSAVALIEYDASKKRSPLVRYQVSEGLELDDKGKLVSYAEYTPFGTNTYNALDSTVEAPRRYRFAKYERDAETGMFHCGERYYAAWLGRWTSPDPIGLADGVNRYCYVHNDPTNLEDSGGMMPTRRRSEDEQPAPKRPKAEEVTPSPSGGKGLQPIKGGNDPANVSDYVRDKVREKSTIQVLRPGHNTAEYRDRDGVNGFQIGIEGLIGCTSMILVSDKGVYFTHWFEDPSFEKIVNPVTQQKAPDDQQDKLFQSHVIDALSKGTRYHKELGQYSEAFKDHNPIAYVMTPTDPKGNGQPTYAARLKTIREKVTELTSPALKWNVHTYDPLRARMTGTETTSWGMALVEYSPYHAEGSAPSGSSSRSSRSSSQRQPQQLRVFMERTTVHHK